MKNVVAAHVSAALVLWASAVFGDEAAVKGRAILAKYAEATITVQLALKQQISFPGQGTQEMESTEEVTGTVIGADGLTLISLSETDPSSLLRMINPKRFADIKMETELRDIRLLMPDNTEISAEIVLRDNDLDMAFVRPIKKPDTPMGHVDLSDEGRAEVLDQVIALNRLGRVVRRACTASVERIAAVVEKPRLFYVPGSDYTRTGLGSPAFALDGTFIGVFLVRAIQGGEDIGDSVVTVIVPAADIRDAASQAPPFKE